MDDALAALAKENQERLAVVAAAETWLRTPYHHAARIKGAGVDCLTLLAEVYHEAGIVPKVKVPYYPKDWHLHKDAERYMDGLLDYAVEIEGPPLPGDIALWKFGRCYSHGAIVKDWPVIIHAMLGRNCSEENADCAQWLKFIGEPVDDFGKPRPMKFFSPWRK